MESQTAIMMSARFHGHDSKENVSTEQPVNRHKRVSQSQLRDTELKERVLARLIQNGARIDRVEIEVERSHVTFRGVVASFYQRQLFISCQHIDGVAGIIDDLTVQLRKRSGDE